MGAKRSGGWGRIRRQLEGWSKPALIGLVKDLYDASAGNRDFLEARFEAGQEGAAGLERYRARIVEQFYPKRGEAKLKLGEARRAIREYAKAAASPAGTVDLMLTYLETGTEFTREFGDIDEAYYRSLSSTLEEMVLLLLRAGPELYAGFRERILELRELGGDLGWGYGDHLTERIDLLDGELAGDEDGNGPEAGREDG